MTIESLGLEAPKMSIARIDTGASLQVQFNPAELSESLEAVYARLTVVGQSHQQMQFVNTNNLKFNLDMAYTAMAGPDALQRLLAARRFLHSLLYPRGATTVAAGGAPRVLFVWPTIISLTCVVTELKGKFTRFNSQGGPVQYTASLAIEEVRDVRILSEEVAALGTLRSGADKTSLGN